MLIFTAFRVLMYNKYIQRIFLSFQAWLQVYISYIGLLHLHYKRPSIISVDTEKPYLNERYGIVWMLPAIQCTRVKVNSITFYLHNDFNNGHKAVLQKSRDRFFI